MDAIQSKKVLGDVQIMKDSTGKGNCAITRKQLMSVGAPAWGNLDVGKVRLPLQDVPADGGAEGPESREQNSRDS